MNFLISSSVGSSIIYFCTKMFGSNPAVGVFYQRVALLGAKQDADRRIVVGLHHFRLEVVKI